MSPRRPLLLALALAGLFGSCGSCNGKKNGTTPEQPGGLPCGLTAARSLAPAPDSPALAILDRHRAEGTAQDLSPEDLKGHCQQLWQDVIEGDHCSGAVDDFCRSDACPTDAAREACETGRPHDRALAQCLEQTLPVFQERYPPCAQFIPPR